MNNIKNQIQQEAGQLALQFYNTTLELERITKRMQELSIALNTVEAVEKELVPSETTSKEEEK